MRPRPDEHQLIQRAQQGDKEAVGMLYEAYVQAIFNYVSYRVESDHVAEDLTAEVFVRMVTGLSTYQYTGAPLGAWLYRIAASRIADYYRARKHMREGEIPENQATDDTDPFGKIAKYEERARLRKALRTLPEDYQTVLILRFMQHQTHAQVAEAMGKSERAVRVMQHRALKALAKALGQSGKSRSYLRGEE
ncbi:MAG: sigma-70 family RNA polymerase sigma factor [Anaerolineaceae bacterium]|nr:sigma-70 family RNA polymerase sigma factor [Anaerolineaceae bacterium]